MKKVFGVLEPTKIGWTKLKEKPKFWILVMLIVIVSSGFSGFSFDNSSYKLDAQNEQLQKIVEGKENTIKIDEKVYRINSIEEVKQENNLMDRENYFLIAFIVLAGMIVVLVGLFVSLVVSTFITIGSTKLFIKSIRNEKLKYEILLSDVSVKKSIRFLIAGFLYILLVIIGIIFFIVPGLYFATKYSLIPYLIVDQDLSIKEAFKASSKYTKDFRMKILGHFLVSILLMILGTLALGFGIVISSIVISIGWAYLYEVLKKNHEDNSVMQKI